MARRFLLLLQGFADNPDQALVDVALLDEAERADLLNGWSDAERDFPRERTVQELIEAQVARCPDRIALTLDDEHWSYRRLNAEADRIAAKLTQLGAAPESLIGVCLERSPAIVAAQLGVLKTGAAYVPLDPGHPLERLSAIAADAGLGLMLTDTTTDPVWRDRIAQTIPIESIDAPISAALHRPLATNLAYVIFTSGSTGRPKGVAVSHRSVVNFLLGMAREPGMAPDDALLAVTTISFDISGLELYLPLVVGARLVIADRASVAEPAKLVQIIHGRRISVMQATPATWRLLYASGYQGRRGLKVLCGGEALAQDLADWLTASFGEVWNVYGPTETTIWSARTRLPPNEPVHLGKAIENTRLYLLDQRRAPAPIGLPGELLIGGEGLARGYWRQPGLTADRFLPDPYSPEPGARMYRTGDLVRYDNHQRLRFLNRLDFQVKIRGFRIELGEIESELREASGVIEAAVTVRRPAHQNDDKRLVAYLVAEQRPEPAELRRYLGERLPHYMIPAAFVFLDALPLNASGKLDRGALSRMPLDEAILEAARDQSPPRDAVEQGLTLIWAELLDLPRIGIRENFFEIGGHSLLAVQLMSRVLAQFGVDLPITVLFREGTIEQMAELLRNTENGLRCSTMVPIKKEGEGAPLFLGHTVLGGVMPYRELAPYFDRPIYAFESPGLNPNTRRLTTVEEMARTYIAAIKTVQPSGPYRIGGWSMGGIIALEIAHQLSRAGEDLTNVFIIDTIPWLDEVSDIDYVRNFASVLAENRQDFLERAELAGLDERAQLELMIQRLRQANPEKTYDSHYLQRFFNTYKNNQIAAAAYRPKYRGEAIVFRCRERDPEPFDRKWRMSGVPHQLIEIPGNHLTLMFPPHVSVLADYLEGRKEIHRTRS